MSCQDALPAAVSAAAAAMAQGKSDEEVALLAAKSMRREPGELKHLSNPRKRNQTRYPK